MRTNEAGATASVDDDRDERRLLIAGRRVPLHDARTFLHRALLQIDALDRQLLLGLHEGFCCAELADRFRRSESCVKTRIHRARCRVRSAVETSVREANGLDAGW